MLEIKNLSLSFGDFALNHLSFRVKKGEYFVLLGASGAGKSILLEAIAGLWKADSGHIYLQQQEITHQRIQNRKVGIVFQDYAIFPHLTVAQNIAYPLKSQNKKREEIKETVQQLADKMGITHLLKRNSAHLSGGEMQRLALARTLAMQPALLLLDEPLSHIDPQKRGELRRLLKQIHREGQTIVHVTHDFEEAIALADRIGIVQAGEIIQIGTPQEVFHHPVNSFVAHFAGIRNFIPCRIIQQTDSSFARLADGQKIQLSRIHPQGTGHILLRAEDILLSANPLQSSAQNTFKGTLQEIIPQPNGMEVILDTGFPLVAKITTEAIQQMALIEGQIIYATFKASAVQFMAD